MYNILSLKHLYINKITPSEFTIDRTDTIYTGKKKKRKMYTSKYRYLLLKSLYLLEQSGQSERVRLLNQSRLVMVRCHRGPGTPGVVSRLLGRDADEAIALVHQLHLLLKRHHLGKIMTTAV